MSAAASPATTAEALRMLTSAMSYLATTDPTQLASSEQAQCLRTLEQIDAMETAARASILGTFTAGKGYCDDGAYSPRAWLINETHVTKGTATRHTAWVRRIRAHPRIADALATGGADRVLRRHRVLLDRSTPGRLPGQCRRDLDRGRADGNGPA